jgi:hypothetical protein
MVATINVTPTKIAANVFMEPLLLAENFSGVKYSHPDGAGI